MVDELRLKYDLATLLRISGLKKQTYYYIKKRGDFDYKNLHIINKIEEIFYENKGHYGSRRICDELHFRGYHVNHKKVERLMKKLNLRPDVYSSYQGSSDTVIENLLDRHFQADKPNEKWVTDVTKFHCYWGKLYLSILIDLYARDVVSFNISKHPDFDQIEDMLNKAFLLYPNVDGLIIHSDMGWQYNYYKYLNILKEHNIRQSMSKKGNCLDNAVAESFFSVLKREVFYGNEMRFKSYKELDNAISEYIDYYNNKRIKHNLKGMTPSSYRAAYKSTIEK